MMMKANEESKSRKNYPDFFVDAPYCTRQFWATLFRSLIKGGRGKGGGLTGNLGDKEEEGTQPRPLIVLSEKKVIMHFTAPSLTNLLYYCDLLSSII